MQQRKKIVLSTVLNRRFSTWKFLLEIFILMNVQKIFICPFALSNKTHISMLRLQSKEWSGALSSFNYNIGFDGKNLTDDFEYNVFGYKIDDLSEKLEIKDPHHIKIDVDGIEHFILEGGPSLLTKVKSVHIEINDDFYDQSEKCKKILMDSGLTLNNKEHSDLIEKSEFRSVYNQTWCRKS